MENDRKWQSVVVFGTYEELPATPQWNVSADTLGRSAAVRKLVGTKDLEPDSEIATKASAHLFYWIRIKTITDRLAR